MVLNMCGVCARFKGKLGCIGTQSFFYSDVCLHFRAKMRASEIRFS